MVFKLLEIEGNVGISFDEMNVEDVIKKLHIISIDS